MNLEKLSMKKLSAWLDQHLLTIIAGFLLIFIPLYPKWPLFDVLPGYNVRVRLEDILILLTGIYFLIQLIRRKIKLTQAPLLKPILLYLLVGFLSTLSALFITKTIWPELIQIGKLYLHLFRRIEYFSLFFIFFFSLKSVKQIFTFFWLLALTVFSVSVYGYGQKYLYWPAYSTMNREFAKGIPVYLTEHARVMSTFGGHFDLAAYIMLTIIPLMIVGWLHRKRLVRIILLSLALFEYWILILSASRTSWVAYMFALGIVFLLLLKKKSFKWVFWRLSLVSFISIFMMISFGDLSERFAQVIKMDRIRDAVLRPFKDTPPPNYISIDDIPFDQQLAIVATDSDTPPTSVKPNSVQPTPEDVYDDPYGEFNRNASTSGNTIHVDYSANALKYGLSAGIRMDVLWPNAIKALKTNPLLGTGYSTLVKSQVWEFTFAESTDNDYLRLLGETGLLGFITFISILLITLKLLWQAFLKTKDPIQYGLFAAGIAITLGLMLNAAYIDVFESSKVAYTYWSIIGLLLALALKVNPHEKNI